MVGAEERELGYLFKLKQSANVKKLIGQIFRKEDWVEAGQKWQGREDELRLSGWSQERRVVVLRRPLRSKRQGGGSGRQEEVQTKSGQTVDLGSAGSNLSGSAI